MADWKIVVTLLVVLAIFLVVLGSRPEISSFLGAVGERVSAVLPMSSEDAGSEFSLLLAPPAAVDFTAENSALQLSGQAEANVGSGTVSFSSASIRGFRGNGHVSENVSLSGSAASMAFDSSRLESVQLGLSSPLAEFSARNVSIADISADDAQGELALNSSVVKFSGKLGVRGIKGSIFLRNGSLEIEGTARSISVPGAGVRIGG